MGSSSQHTRMTARKNQLSVDLKVNFDTIQRRISLPTKVPQWRELSKVIKERFELPEHFPLGLSYQDEEGEQVTISSDKELTEVWPTVTNDDERDLDALPPLRFTIVMVPRAHPGYTRGDTRQSNGGPFDAAASWCALENGDLSPPVPDGDYEEEGDNDNGGDDKDGPAKKPKSDFHKDVKAFIDIVKAKVADNKEVKEAFDKVAAHAHIHCGDNKKKDKKRKGGEGDDGKEEEDGEDLQDRISALTLVDQESKALDGLTGGIVGALLTPALMGPPPHHCPPPPASHPHHCPFGGPFGRRPHGPSPPRPHHGGDFPHPQPPPFPHCPPHHHYGGPGFGRRAYYHHMHKSRFGGRFEHSGFAEAPYPLPRG